jgi:hypothetical protein
MPSLKLVGELGLDSTGFNRGLASAESRAQKFSGGLRSALGGAFSIAAITAFAKSTIDAVSKIADMSKELNVSSESLQEMEYAAKLSGSSVDAIATAFRGLSKARAEALKDPNSNAGQVFKAMGIGAAELQSNSIEKTFRRIADVVKTTDFGANEIAMIAEVLGRSGQELIPVFRNGLSEAGDEARKLGIIMKDDVVQQIDAAGDSIDRLIKRLRVPMASAIGFVARALRDLWDVQDMTVGGLGAAIGSMMGGGNGIEGFKAHITDIMDRRQQEDDQVKKAVENPEKRKQAPFDFAGKPIQEQAGRVAQIPSDQFQRIGAFTGTSAMAGQRELAYRQLTVLEKLREDLTRTGVLIRGTD